MYFLLSTCWKVRVLLFYKFICCVKECQKSAQNNNLHLLPHSVNRDQ